MDREGGLDCQGFPSLRILRPFQEKAENMHGGGKHLPKQSDGLLLPPFYTRPFAIGIPRLFIKAEIIHQQNSPQRAELQPRLQALPEGRLILVHPEVG